MRWLKKPGSRLRSAPAAAASRRAHSYRPTIELLEERAAAAVFSSALFTIVTSDPPATVTPGQTVTLAFYVYDRDLDPGSDTLTLNWGDGTIIRDTQVNDGSRFNGQYELLVFSESHTYLTAGSLNGIGFFLRNGDGLGLGGNLGAVQVALTGDVTNSVLLLATKKSFSSSSGNTTLQMLLVNDGSQPITGPLFVVLDGLPGSTKLTNATGVSVFEDPGKPFVLVPVGQLSPGQSFPLTLTFHNSAGHSVAPTSFHAEVFAGTPWV